MDKYSSQLVHPTFQQVGAVAEETLFLLSRTPTLAEAEITVRLKLRKEDVRKVLELLSRIGLIQVDTAGGRIGLEPIMKDILLTE